MSERICSTGGCERPSEVRGYCRACYQRWRKHGNPNRFTCEGCGSPIRRDGRFCKANPECVKKQRAAFYAANKHRILAQQAEYYAANKVRQHERNAQWRKANPERAREILARYMARADRHCAWQGCEEFAVPRNPFCQPHHAKDQGLRYARQRAKLKELLFARQQGVCPDGGHGGCGLPLADLAGSHVDHLIPRSRGGPDDDWNLQLMHPVCNERKKDKMTPAALALMDCQHITR